MEEKRARVWQLRVANQQLDGQLRTLDEQIGLLVRNRINLQVASSLLLNITRSGRGGTEREDS